MKPMKNIDTKLLEFEKYLVNILSNSTVTNSNIQLIYHMLEKINTNHSVSTI
jgi:hypothetical protein